jgi:hypothetical protein
MLALQKCGNKQKVKNLRMLLPALDPTISKIVDSAGLLCESRNMARP